MENLKSVNLITIDNEVYKPKIIKNDIETKTVILKLYKKPGRKKGHYKTGGRQKGTLNKNKFKTNRKRSFKLYYVQDGQKTFEKEFHNLQPLADYIGKSYMMAWKIMNNIIKKYSDSMIIEKCEK